MSGNVRAEKSAGAMTPTSSMPVSSMPTSLSSRSAPVRPRSFRQQQSRFSSGSMATSSRTLGKVLPPGARKMRLPLPLPLGFEESADHDVIVTKVGPKPKDADQWPVLGERVLMFTSPYDGASMMSALGTGVVRFQIMMENHRDDHVDIVLQPRGVITIKERLKIHNQRLKIMKEAHLEQVRNPETHRCPCLARVVSSAAFEVFVVFLIVSNCVCIGWQADHADNEIMSFLDIVFTVCFCLELVLRAMVGNWTFFLIRENYLDIFLVTTSLLHLFIADLTILRKFAVLRTLRLARVANMIRYRPELASLVELLEGTVNNTAIAFWTMVMVLSLLYFFAIISTAVIGKANAFKEMDEAQTYFGDVFTSMVTLFQIMTLDGWTEIMQTLMSVPGQGFRVCTFFMLFMSVAVFVLMNLIVAVIVQNSFESAQEIKNYQVKMSEAKMMADLKQLKNSIVQEDWTGQCEEEGIMSLDHFLEVSVDPAVKQKLNLMKITAASVVEVWKIMQLPDGRIRIDDFIDGLRRKMGSVNSKDMLRLLRDYTILDFSVQELEVNIEASFVRLESVRRRLRSTSSEIGSTRRTLGRAKDAVKIAAITQSL